MFNGHLVLGLTGFARAGKDTVANRLVEAHGFARDAFADDIKRAALAIDPWVSEDRDGTFRRLSEIVSAIGWDAAKANPEVRRIVNTTGTEAGWMIHGKRLWIDRVEERLHALPAGVPLVITDVRFPEEEEWLRGNQGWIVEVVRPGNLGATGANAQHSSVTSEVLADLRIVNDGSLEELYYKVDHLMNW